MEEKIINFYSKKKMGEKKSQNKRKMKEWRKYKLKV